METGVRTPLVEMFRRGTVDVDIRMFAARGMLAPRGHEQLALLVLLTGDESADVAAAAEATLAGIPAEALGAFLARGDVPAELKAFFAARGVTLPADVVAADDGPLVDVAPPVDPSASDEDEGSALQRIAAMNVAQRLTLATKGSREERAILIRDPNKIVAAAVLSSPKMTEMEVESVARMANVSEDVLRIISTNRAWMKNYQVALALTKNPKTPIAVSMNLLVRLSERDLKQISTDRNVPDVLRMTARKKLVADKKDACRDCTETSCRIRVPEVDQAGAVRPDVDLGRTAGDLLQDVEADHRA